MAENPNEAPVTARIFFDGVMLMCINRNNHCEVGIIRCPEHVPVIEIQTTTLGTTVSRDPIPVTGDMYIQVVNPETEGVRPRPAADDDFDFHFVPDIEGPNLHADKVSVYTDRLSARVAVTSGMLYSRALHPETFNRVEWSEDRPEGRNPVRFDRIADDVGLNIVCRDGDGSGINIINTITGERLQLLKLPDTTYTIRIDNNCFPPGSEPNDQRRTDFRFYYDVIEAKDGRRFDFDVDDPRAPSPRVCEVGHLSRTDTLGFSFEPEPDRIVENKQEYGSKPEHKKK